MNERSQLLLLDEVAREARVSLSTVRFWIGAGKLPSVRPGRRRLVRRSDLDAFLNGDSADGVSDIPDARLGGG
jgi:excisionase family DNA binding protein